MNNETQEYDYVVVGSGAGGGTLAARLVEHGYSVLVLEAGDDPLAETPEKQEDNQRSLEFDYKVPAFHSFCSEQASIRWDYWVRHYSDPKQAKSDPKARDGKIWYPRVGALGGCASHNAMILLYPANSDWNTIAELTKDYSWNAEHMRSYFEKIENCQHRFSIYRLLAKIGINPTRHGWHGWLKTEVPIARSALQDEQLVRLIMASALHVFASWPSRFVRFIWRWLAQLDPNDWRMSRDNAWGIRTIPLTTNGHHRYTPRERLREVQKRYPKQLHIMLNTLVTRLEIVRSEDGELAVQGVHVEKGKRLYGAHPDAHSSAGEPLLITARHEVILSAGAFNSPQLLQLSGIGNPADLKKMAIECVLPSMHVGQHLQDRYEVPIVSEMKFEQWNALKGAKYSTDDPHFKNWQKNPGSDIYATNGGVLSVIANSTVNGHSAQGDSAGVPFLQRPPDLYFLALLSDFRGYEPGYSQRILQAHNKLTWIVLKGHTNNTAGYVKLHSNDPHDTPDINFKYFEEGNDEWEEDLTATVEGVNMVRDMNKVVKNQIKEEIVPGAAVQSNEELRDFVRKNAWGHHASCTCRMGRNIADSVVDSNFRVHGIGGLRIVDASVFPKIPGLFILGAIYMIAEKAADAIIESRS